uniref:Uncharacterized protein LOC100175103 n=1 Tax=Phallusia mammillata TaxID=59560 RepID=A0A6F9DGU7_9ASCI|nr:uncharacterized protein LOC100175103 [Phallusia mammillata]
MTFKELLLLLCVLPCSWSIVCQPRSWPCAVCGGAAVHDNVAVYYQVVGNPAASFSFPLPSGTCVEPKFITLTHNVRVFFVGEQYNFYQAATYCRERGALLLFKPTSTIQSQIAHHLNHVRIIFRITRWWIGLDEIGIEGALHWSNGETLQPTDYTNWISPLPNDDIVDCVETALHHGWKWGLDGCLGRKGFVCQEVNCHHPALVSVSEPRVYATCSRLCGSHEECVGGSCKCNRAFFVLDCAYPSSIRPLAEKNDFGKTFVFFREKLTYSDASDFCIASGGTLAIPSTEDRHKFFLKTAVDSNLHKHVKAVWLGMSDKAVEGVWKFYTGAVVNLPHDFGGLVICVFSFNPFFQCLYFILVPLIIDIQTKLGYLGAIGFAIALRAALSLYNMCP